MLKTIFNKRTFIYLSVVGIIMGFVVACLNVIPGENLLLEDAFLVAREQRTKIEYGNFAYNPFSSFFCVIVFLAVITHFFVKDYDVAKSYIFHRVDSISKWYGFKMLQIFVCCLFSQIVYNVFLLLTTYAMGFRAGNIRNVIWYLAFGIIAGFLVLLSVSVMCCVVAFRLKPHISSALFMAIVVIGIVAMYYVKNDFLFSLNAVAYYFTSFHIEKLPAYMKYPYPSWIYYVGLFVLSAIEAFIGSRILMKTDSI